MSESMPYPNYVACVASALRQSQRPLTIEQLIDEVAKQRPVGEYARTAITRAVNKLFQAVSTAPDQVGWLSHLLNGSVYRHPLSSEEVRRGFLMLDELEHLVFFPQFFQAHRPDGRTVHIELFGGPTIEATATIEHKTWSLLLGNQFTAWVNELGAQGRDDLLISVVDGEAGRYAVRVNLREMRDERAIEQRNIQLALQAEELVSDDSSNRLAMPTWDLASLLIGQGFFHEMPPVDDFHYVLHEYSLLRFTDGMGYQLDPDAERGDGKRHMISALPASSGDSAIQVTDQDTPPSYSDQFPEANVGHDYSTGPDGEPMQYAECAEYAEYVAKCYEDDPHFSPLSHGDFHLLEAELEMLIRLEHEFGRLLNEQEERKTALAAQLFIDLEFFILSDWDSQDDSEYDDPPFWQN